MLAWDAMPPLLNRFVKTIRREEDSIQLLAIQDVFEEVARTRIGAGAVQVPSVEVVATFEIRMEVVEFLDM